ncbi:MAG: Uma2 family endonuclease [Gemmataceae bacterium]|nr:Uma2 family endonuclease [Gemmataceae bacterium]
MSTATATPDVDRDQDEAARELVVPKGFEFVNGQLKELNVSAKSSRVGGRLSRLLDNHCESNQPGWVFPADTPFQCFTDEPKKVRKPDAAFVALDRYSDEQYDTEGYVSVVPDLIAEVVSPNDLAYEVSEKRREWLAAGVKLVWVVEPVQQTIHVYRPDGTVTLLHETDTLTGESVLPGFAVPVAELFRRPTAAPK